MTKLKPIKLFRITDEKTGEILVETKLFKVVVFCTETGMLAGGSQVYCIFDDNTSCELNVSDAIKNPDLLETTENSAAQGLIVDGVFILDVYPSRDDFVDTMLDELDIEPYLGETIISFISPDTNTYQILKYEMSVVGINAEVVRVFERNTAGDRHTVTPALSVEMRVDCEYSLLRKLVETSKLTKGFKETLLNTTIEENPNVFQ
jgi:hypothetical protein|tara:strand:- start:1035 stop:1649 length:615 start_codon:yes stop_codon:yes gene_type:complete